jgi:tetratricopeptide (TPR) repeat protein
MNNSKLLKNFLPIALILAQTISIGISFEYSSCVYAANSSKSKTSQSSQLAGLDSQTSEAISQGRFNDALDLLVSQTANDNTVNQKHAWLAFTYMFLSKCEPLKDLAKKFGETKDSDAYKLTEGFNLICQNKLADAKTLLSTLSSNKDTDVLSNLSLAAVHAKSSEPALAIEYCQKAVKLNPDFAWGYRTIGFLQDKLLKDPVKAEEAYKQALQIEPEFKEARDLLVNLYTSQNKYDEAIGTAQAAIKLNQKNADNYYRLSQIYTQQFRLKEAAELLDKCTDLAPNNSRFHRAQAHILRTQGNINEAIAEQQKAVDISTDKAFELIELASLNQLAGNTNKSIDNLKEALKLSPTNQTAHQNLVTLLNQEKRFDDLVEEYKRALTQAPKQADLRLGLGNALIAAGKMNEAIDALKEAANTNNNDPLPLRQLGAIYLNQKDYPQAIKAYTKALNINPSSVDDLATLGLSYARNKDYMQAETAFVTAIALHQLTGSQTGINRLDLMRSLADVLFAEGRYTEAVINLEVVAAAKKDIDNKLLLLEAKALRDNSAHSISELVAYYKSLSADDQQKYRLDLVLTLIGLKKADLAQEQISKVDNTELQNNCDWLLAQAAVHRLKGDLNKAEQLAISATKLASLTPDQSSRSYIELGQIQYDLNKAGDTIVSLNKAIDLDAKSFVAYELLSQAYLKKSDAIKAEGYAKKSAETNPYNTKAYLLLGDIYASAGKPKDAEINYKRAVELSPASIEAHRRLANLYKKLAQKENAKKEEDAIAQIEKHNSKGE